VRVMRSWSWTAASPSAAKLSSSKASSDPLTPAVSYALRLEFEVIDICRWW
jgi:hypothetical protein